MTTRAQPHGLAAFVKSIATRGLAMSVGIGLLFWYASGEWIIVPAMLCFWLFWHLLPHDDVPPGLQFSFSYHLFQIVAGVFYVTFTGRLLSGHSAPQYQLMMTLAVGALMAIFLGFLIGDRWLSRNRKAVERVQINVTLKPVFAAYIVAVLSTDAMIRIAFQIPAFTQAIVAFSAAKAGLLYLILRRLFREQRYAMLLPLLAFETARGFTGFYSSFKEPLVLALIAATEVFQPKKVSQWALVTVLVASVLGMSVLWLGIRGAVREDIVTTTTQRSSVDRLRFALQEAGTWWDSDTEYKMYDADALADRVWEIQYTALALDRVPKVIPHQEGAILSAAIQHILTPRFLNPNKPVLPSESDDVVRYSGVKVAGREEDTTIAFGYVIQSYIDFGIPGMFLPCFGFGLFMGLAYRWFMTTVRHQEILIALVAVAFWLNIMPYNISWAKMFGKALTSIVYVGAIGILLDRYLYAKRRRDDAMPAAPHPLKTH